MWFTGGFDNFGKYTILILHIVSNCRCFVNTGYVCQHGYVLYTRILFLKNTFNLKQKLARVCCVTFSQGMPGCLWSGSVSASRLVSSSLAEAAWLSGQSVAPAGLSVLQDTALSDDGTWGILSKQKALP